MTNTEPTLETLQADLASFSADAAELRKASQEAQKAVTLEGDKKKIAGLQETAKEAEEAAVAMEEDVATIKQKIADLKAESEHGTAAVADEDPKSSSQPVEGMPCTYRMMVNGPRVIMVPAVVKRIHSKPKGAKAAGLVDLDIMRPGMKPQTLEKIYRGTEADTWSAIE